MPPKRDGASSYLASTPSGRKPRGAYASWARSHRERVAADLEGRKFNALSRKQDPHALTFRVEQELERRWTALPRATREKWERKAAMKLARWRDDQARAGASAGKAAAPEPTFTPLAAKAMPPPRAATSLTTDKVKATGGVSSRSKSPSRIVGFSSRINGANSTRDRRQGANTVAGTAEEREEGTLKATLRQRSQKVHQPDAEQLSYEDALRTPLSSVDGGRGLAVRPSEIHDGGLGLFAQTDIQKGRVIIEMTELRILGADEFEVERMRRNLPADFMVHIGKDRVATDEANNRLFEEHGCDPASPTWSWKTALWYRFNHGSATDANVRPLFGRADPHKPLDVTSFQFVAKRFIKNGEELRFDYGNPDPAWASNQAMDSVTYCADAAAAPFAAPPIRAPGSRFDVVFKKPGPIGLALYSAEDVDDTESEAQETFDIFIEQVAPGSEAEAGGVFEECQLVGFAGRPVTSLYKFRADFQKAARPATLTFLAPRCAQTSECQQRQEAMEVDEASEQTSATVTAASGAADTAGKTGATEATGATGDMHASQTAAVPSVTPASEQVQATAPAAVQPIALPRVVVAAQPVTAPTEIPPTAPPQTQPDTAPTHALPTPLRVVQPIIALPADTPAPSSIHGNAASSAAPAADAPTLAPTLPPGPAADAPVPAPTLQPPALVPKRSSSLPAASEVSAPPALPSGPSASPSSVDYEPPLKKFRGHSTVVRGRPVPKQAVKWEDSIKLSDGKVVNPAKSGWLKSTHVRSSNDLQAGKKFFNWYHSDGTMYRSFKRTLERLEQDFSGDVDESGENDNWIQCSSCDKWIIVTPNINVASLPGTFVCSDAVWASERMRQCSKKVGDSQEGPDNDDEEVEFIACKPRHGLKAQPGVGAVAGAGGSPLKAPGSTVGDSGGQLSEMSNAPSLQSPAPAPAPASASVPVSLPAATSVAGGAVTTSEMQGDAAKQTATSRSALCVMPDLTELGSTDPIKRSAAWVILGISAGIRAEKAREYVRNNDFMGLNREIQALALLERESKAQTHALEVEQPQGAEGSTNVDETIGARAGSPSSPSTPKVTSATVPLPSTLAPLPSAVAPLVSPMVALVAEQEPALASGLPVLAVADRDRAAPNSIGETRAGPTETLLPEGTRGNGDAVDVHETEYELLGSSPVMEELAMLTDPAAVLPVSSPALAPAVVNLAPTPTVATSAGATAPSLSTVAVYEAAAPAAATNVTSTTRPPPPPSSPPPPAPPSPSPSPPDADGHRGIDRVHERKRCSNCECLGHTKKYCPEPIQPPASAPTPAATEAFVSWLGARKQSWRSDRGGKRRRLDTTDLNAASQASLQQIISSALATAVITERASNGPYKSMEDLRLRAKTRSCWP